MAIHPPRYPKLNIILESFWPFPLCPAGHPALSVHFLNISNHFSPFSQPSFKPPSSMLVAFLLVFLIPLLSSSNSLSKTTTIIYLQGKLNHPFAFSPTPCTQNTHTHTSELHPQSFPCAALCVPFCQRRGTAPWSSLYSQYKAGIEKVLINFC